MRTQDKTSKYVKLARRYKHTMAQHYLKCKRQAVIIAPNVIFARLDGVASFGNLLQRSHSSSFIFSKWYLTDFAWNSQMACLWYKIHTFMSQSFASATLDSWKLLCSLCIRKTSTVHGLQCKLSSFA